MLDVIGQIGSDPGSQWGTGLTSTADNTLRRKADICAGDPVGSDAFDPAVEWDGFANDTFDGLGAHTSTCGVVPPPPADPVLNEFSASTTGTDVEYLEVLGTPGSDYSAYDVLQVRGDGTNAGTVRSVTPIAGTDAAGLHLADLAPNTLLNSTITLLLVRGSSAAPGDDLDTDDDGTLDSEPWAAIADGVAVRGSGSSDATYDATVLSNGTFPAGGASRIPDGADTDSASDWVLHAFDGTPTNGRSDRTPGQPNQLSTVPDSCTSETTTIPTIQGNGAASPLDGESVLTEGVVVGDFAAGSRRALYLQDPAGDGDPATSDGIYVFTDAPAVQVGQTVRVRGTVDEFNDLTEITNVSDLLLCDEAITTVAPTTLTLPISSPEAFERYEGMLVTFPQDLVISEYFNFDRFNELVLTDERQPIPTSVVEPGPAAVALAAQQALGMITLDDARSASNPDPARHPDGGEFTLDHSFRGGDLVSDVTGVMDYQFGKYRIQPTTGADHTPTNPRTERPEVGGSMTVGSFNVLNYFTTLGSRGADNAEELQRQEDKIVAAITELDADVVGLMEIENNTAAIDRLVDALNAQPGAEGRYDYVDTGVVGTDAIKVAFIYQPDSVSPVGDYAVLDSSVDPRFLDTKNRPALAQTFRETATGEVVTVSVNHLKSKGSDCNDLGDPDTGDGSGNCNRTRTEAAEALVEWLDGDPTGSGSDRFLIIGDLNAYDHEDPIDAILAEGYTDLSKKFGGELAYSYVFDGKFGYLDHALSSDALTPLVTGAEHWHINADEADLIDYDTSFKKPAQDALYAPDPFRSSDHDPVLIGLSLDTTAPELAVSVSPDVLSPPNHQYVTVQATVTATDGDAAEPTVELVSVTSNEPDNGKGDGNTTRDIVIVDDTTFRLRAERSGAGDGRVYTITYRATDAAGNSTTESATVTVPKGGTG